MKRASAYATYLLVVLAWFAQPFGVHGGELRRATPSAKVEQSAPGPRPTVTIVFRGLMVFHPDPARQYFEVGILRAPEHTFRIKVEENSPAGSSSFSFSLEQLGGLEQDVWSFEFSKSTKRGVSFYQNGPFDRTRGIGEERDFRWAVDLEGREFYNQLLTTEANQIGPVVRITSGEFYTKTKTAPLMRNKGNGTFQYFGSAANEIAADAFIETGVIVLRSKESGREILRLNEKPNTSYKIVIENEPVAEGPDAHLAASSTHFHYYYRLITKPKAEWYDFRLDDAVGFTPTSDVERARFAFASYLHPVFPRDRIPCMPAGVGQRKRSLTPFLSWGS